MIKPAHIFEKIFLSFPGETTHRRALVFLVTGLALILASCTAIQATEPTEVINDPTATSEAMLATDEATPTVEVETPSESTPTAAPEESSPTPIATPETTEVSASVEINNLIIKGSYTEAVELTKQALEAGEFESLNQAIKELWRPMIEEETVYSEAVMIRLSRRFSGLELNEHGLPAIYDEEDNLLIEKTVPGTSNVEWAIPLMELTTNRFPSEDLKEDAVDVFNLQFKEGLGLGTSSRLYNLFSVIDDEVQLESEFELPNGQKITTLLRCYYYDAAGNLQMINIPFYAYDPQELRAYTISSGFWNYDSLNELNEDMNITKEAAKNELGPRTIEGLPHIEFGQIFIIGFNMSVKPSLYSLAKDFFEDTVGLFHTQESLDAFAQTGDPSHLPTIPELGEPLLIHLYESGNTIFD